MPFRTQVCEDHVHVHWHGTLAVEDLRQLGRELPRIGMQLRRAPNVLHTFDEVMSSRLNFDAVHNYCVEVAKERLPNTCRVASVAHNPTSYGIARMFQAMNSNPSIEIEVFDGLAEALAWLRKEQA